jgi:LuxR family maltose regulon positive regulatory protein
MITAGDSCRWRTAARDACRPGSPVGSSVTCAASQAADRALALAEADRLVLPFAMTGAGELLEAPPRHQTAHAALLADILDLLHPTSRRPRTGPITADGGVQPGRAAGAAVYADQPVPARVADQLSVSANTVGTHLRGIYAKLGVRDRSLVVQRTRELRAAGGRSAALARLSGSR